MNISTSEQDGDRIMTIRIDELVIDQEQVEDLRAVLTDNEWHHFAYLILQIGGDGDDEFAQFPSWQTRQDGMRHFGRWEDVIGILARLKAKTIIGYQGSVGPAGTHLGMVVDVRMAITGAHLRVGSLRDGQFPGTIMHWLPRFVGQGVAQRLLLFGQSIDAPSAAHIGLVDMVVGDLRRAMTDVIAVLHPVPNEAACFTRRIINDSFHHERPMTVEQIKAARYRLTCDMEPNGR